MGEAQVGQREHAAEALAGLDLGFEAEPAGERQVEVVLQAPAEVRELLNT